MTDAFFLLDGDEAVATDWCRGPWDEQAAHFGPPAALLGRAVEAAAGGEDKRVARLTFEVLSPVPLGRLRVTTEVVRPGRRVDLVEATLVDLERGRSVALCRAWRQRRPASPLVLPEAATADLPERMTPPEDGAPMSLFRPPEVRGYHVGTQWLSVAGDTLTPGPAKAWCRMAVPLVGDEEATPLQRLLVAADSGNGLSAVAGPADLLFVNVDLSVHLDRDPVGEWIGLDAVTTMSPVGGGTATSVLHDRDGAFGRGAQSLFVDRIGQP